MTATIQMNCQLHSTYAQTQLYAFMYEQMSACVLNYILLYSCVHKNSGAHLGKRKCAAFHKGM